MKKQLEDLTHMELVSALVYDDSVADNIFVSDDYPTDENGNTLITMGFEGKKVGKARGSNAMILFTFNKKGRLVRLEAAVRESGQKQWQIASSEILIDMKTRFMDLDPMPKDN